MAVPPTPLDPSPGDKLGATTWDTQVRDVMNFLLDPPRCLVFRAVVQTITNGGTSLIGYDSEVYDTDLMHSTSSNTSRITFTTAGTYLVHVHTTLANAVYTTLDQTTNVNSGGSIGGGTTIRTASFDNNASLIQQCDFIFERSFNAGDYIENFITQTSGASRNTGTTTYGTFVTARWVGLQ